MRIAALGDIHGQLDATDISWLEGQALDLVLVTGDLPGRLHQGMDAVMKTLGTLRTRAVLIPGNHDAPSLAQLLIDQSPWGASAGGIEERLATLACAVSPVEVGGYSVHELTDEIAVLVGRPLAMDGRRVSFASAVFDRWGVRTMADSAALLKQRVDACPHRRWLVLGHNGPAGLGAGSCSPWGLPGRDLGDPDLAEVIAHLKATGRSVPLVVAGHVHHRAGARGRAWCVVEDGTTYVNAARVPRHDRSGTRHAVRVTLEGGAVDVEAVAYSSASRSSVKVSGSLR